MYNFCKRKTFNLKKVLLHAFTLAEAGHSPNTITPLYLTQSLLCEVRQRVLAPTVSTTIAPSIINKKKPGHNPPTVSRDREREYFEEELQITKCMASNPSDKLLVIA